MVTVTRDYGETANERPTNCSFTSVSATISTRHLIAVAIGWREALVTLVVIPTTILLTMFAANLMGYTINRVSLFALIFSIGILVDDAIVVVENIRPPLGRCGTGDLGCRHHRGGRRGRNPDRGCDPDRVAALLPMLFVSGLMGPYMAPIPANASAAMLFSFLRGNGGGALADAAAGTKGRRCGRSTFRARRRRARANLSSQSPPPIVASKRSAWIFLNGVGIATTAVDDPVRHPVGDGQVAAVRQQVRDRSDRRPSRGLPASKTPSGRCLRRPMSPAVCPKSFRCSPMPARRRRSTSTVWSGTLICANGRNWASCRSISPHVPTASGRAMIIALDLRQRLKAVSVPDGTSIKVVEVRPVRRCWRRCWPRSTGPTPQPAGGDRRAEEVFAEVPFIVDIDDSIGQKRPRLRLSIDQDRLEFFGVEQRDVYDTIQTLFGGVSGGIFAPRRGTQSDRDRGPAAEARPRLDRGAGIDAGACQYASRSKTVVELGQLVKATMEEGSPQIFRRDAGSPTW